MAFVIGVVVFAAVIWWLSRVKQRDIAACAAILGLEPVKASPSRGQTPEGFAYFQRAVLQGTLLGRPATLLSRIVRHPRTARRQRYGSEFTVLECALARPARVSLRLQPAGVLESLEHAVRGTVGDRVFFDDTFDAAYAVYASDAAGAKAVLTEERRLAMLTLRTQIAGGVSASAAGYLASALVLGTFHVEGNTARYSAFGSPTRATAEHVKTAAPLLLDLADAAGS